jgi:hypothetical protein
MDKHEGKNYNYEKIKGKDLRKWFGHFWFFNHSLSWFLVVPPKGGFVDNQLPKRQKLKMKN